MALILWGIRVTIRSSEGLASSLWGISVELKVSGVGITLCGVSPQGGRCSAAGLVSNLWGIRVAIASVGGFGSICGV